MAFGHRIFVAALASVLAGTAAFPLATGLAFEGITDQAEAVSPGEPIAATDINPYRLDPVIRDGLSPIDAGAAEPPESTAATDAEMGIDDELICLAKVVLHEAGNQSREGQLAVAQVVMNRVASPLFPDTICGVVMQRGQFFNVHAYNPRHDARWETAIEVAIDARNRMSAPVIADAIFFHAAHARPSFHRSRQRVVQLGDHVFYR